MALAAALMAGIGCGIMGMLASARLKKRQTLLNAWMRFIARIQTTLSTQRLPMDQVLESGLGEYPVLDAQMQNTIALMRTTPELSAQEAFVKSGATGYEEKDLLLIHSLLVGLGTGSLEKRQGAVKLSLDAFSAAYEQAKQAYEKNGRLYVNLGWLGGFALVLLLI